MNKEVKYELDFFEALKIVLNGGTVRGDDFMAGIFLKMNTAGQLVIVNAANLYDEATYVCVRVLARQKFRQLSVMTMKELSV